MQALITILRNIITRSKTVDDQIDNNYSYSVNISTYGQTTNSEAYYPYGMASRAPKNSVAITFLIGGQPENKTSFLYDPSTRFTGLEVGEVIIGNQIKQTFIKFNEDGTIDIQTDDTLTVKGNQIISGNLTVKGSNVVMDGDVLIKGNLIVEGNINGDGEITDANTSLSTIRTTYNSHDHQDPVDGTTSTPNQMIP